MAHGMWDMAPPSKEDCIRAIENLDPDYKGIINVIRPLKINHKIAKSLKHAIVKNYQELHFFSAPFY